MDGDWLFGFMTKLSGGGGLGVGVGGGGQGPDGASAHLGPSRESRGFWYLGEASSSASSSSSATLFQRRLKGAL